MAIARVGSGSGRVDGNGVTSLVFNYTPNAAGNLLTLPAATVPYPTNSSTKTVTDSSSTAWTIKSNIHTTSGGLDRTALVAYRENIPSGLTSVTMAYNGEAFYCHGSVEEWSGVATSSSFDTQVDADSTSETDTTLASGNITLGNANGLVIGACYGDDSGSATWGSYSGWTELMQWGDTSASSAGQTAYRIASGSTGPYSVTWSYPANTYGMCSILVSFLPAATSSGSRMGLLGVG